MKQNDSYCNGLQSFIFANDIPTCSPDSVYIARDARLHRKADRGISLPQNDREFNMLEE